MSLSDWRKTNITKNAAEISKKPKKVKPKEMAHIIVNKRAEIVMLDVIYFPTDTEQNEFKYALICRDVCTGNVDCEPMKFADSATIYEAWKIILKRKFILKPRFQIITDDNKQFLGVFLKYMKDNGIIHR